MSTIAENQTVPSSPKQCLRKTRLSPVPGPQKTRLSPSPSPSPRGKPGCPLLLSALGKTRLSPSPAPNIKTAPISRTPRSGCRGLRGRATQQSHGREPDPLARTPRSGQKMRLSPSPVPMQGIIDADPEPGRWVLTGSETVPGPGKTRLSPSPRKKRLSLSTAENHGPENQTVPIPPARCGRRGIDIGKTGCPLLLRKGA